MGGGYCCLSVSLFLIIRPKTPPLLGVYRYVIFHFSEGSGFVGETALHSCAHSGNVEIFKLLLARGATITRGSNGETPLMIAAYKGHDDLVKFLMGTPDCSRDDITDALELLGTFYWQKDDIDKCLSLWQQAMEERYRRGKPVVWKQEATEKVPFTSLLRFSFLFFVSFFFFFSFFLFLLHRAVQKSSLRQCTSRADQYSNFRWFKAVQNSNLLWHIPRTTRV